MPCLSITQPIHCVVISLLNASSTSTNQNRFLLLVSSTYQETKLFYPFMYSGVLVYVEMLRVNQAPQTHISYVQSYTSRHVDGYHRKKTAAVLV